MTDNDLRYIAEKYGTPSFLFDVDSFQERLQTINKILENKIHICYAMKANPFLISYAEPYVSNIEVCSPGEEQICEMKNFPSDKIILSGVNKTADDIESAVKYNCGIYTAESPLHVKLLNECAGKHKKILNVILRLTSGSQFGMDKSIIENLISKQNEFKNLRFTGIHYFVGTQRKNLKKQIKEISEITEYCRTLKSTYNLDLQRIEYGPGLAVPYFEGESFDDTLAPLKELYPYLLKLNDIAPLTIEMGRFFAAECGYYLTKVMDLKTNCNTNYAILDGGINHLNYFGQLMGMKLPKIIHLCNYNKKTDDKNWTLCGSLCSTGDILVRNAKFSSLKYEDILVFCNSGAYTITEGIDLFLSRKMPQVIIYKNKNAFLVREFFNTCELNTAQTK